MSAHNICFCGEIKKILIFFQLKNVPYLELRIAKMSRMILAFVALIGPCSQITPFFFMNKEKLSANNRF